LSVGILNLFAWGSNELIDDPVRGLPADVERKLDDGEANVQPPNLTGAGSAGDEKIDLTSQFHDGLIGWPDQDLRGSPGERADLRLEAARAVLVADDNADANIRLDLCDFG
jgi:hypothetical protein